MASDGFELRWAGKRPLEPGPLEPARLEPRFGAGPGAGERERERDELYHGDNLAVLLGLVPRYRGRVKLIYLDPPFCSQAAYKRKIRLRGAGGGAGGGGVRFSQTQDTDKWCGDA